MLVCNVSLRPSRRAIAAELAETVAATDATATGNIVFATLVDDPANVGDLVNAYLGEIMLEAASAAETVDGTIPQVYGVTIAETITTTDTTDATVGAASTTTWNPSDKTTNLVLTNGNLSAGSTVSGTEAVRATAGVPTGTKKYFEVSFTALSGGNNTGCGIIPLANSLSSWAASGAGGLIIVAFGPGNIYINTGGFKLQIGSFASGTVCCAVDLVNKQFWARVNGGNWNASGTANPATNTGGIDLSTTWWAGTDAAYPAASMNEIRSPCSTVNFGPSFAFTPPSGFSTI